MNAKILLALDGSEPSMRAARYVVNLLGNQAIFENRGVFVTLFHVLIPMPSSLLGADDYEFPRTLWEAEFERRTASLEETKKAVKSQVFEPVREMFLQAGFGEDQIQTKFSSSTDAAHAILEECDEGGYDTVVMGKRGLSRIRSFLTGSVTEKVVRHTKGHTVWIIE